MYNAVCSKCDQKKADIEWQKYLKEQETQKAIITKNAPTGATYQETYDSTLGQVKSNSYSTGIPTAENLQPIWKTEYCTLEEELNNHHDNVIITTTDDAYKLLHNFWVDAGRDVAILATQVLGASDGIAKPVIDTKKLVHGFDDFAVFAEKLEIKGKTFITFSGRNNRNQKIMHALVNGVRIKMNGKKYPIDSPKMQQLGFAPKTRYQGYKGAGAATFIISASIATTDLILNDDYHLVNWFGAVGSDMFKFLLQAGGGEILFLGAITLELPLIIGAGAVIILYISTEWFFEHYKVTDKVTKGLENVIDH